MTDQQFLLKREFFEEAIQIRIYTTQLAELAVTLAQAAGEHVTRPPSAQQIARAIEVNGVETQLVLDALTERLQRLYREGKLPADAGVPRW